MEWWKSCVLRWSWLKGICANFSEKNILKKNLHGATWKLPSLCPKDTSSSSMQNSLLPYRFFIYKVGGLCHLVFWDACIFRPELVGIAKFFKNVPLDWTFVGNHWTLHGGDGAILVYSAYMKITVRINCEAI